MSRSALLLAVAALAGCASRMRLRVQCDGHLLMVADVTPGVTMMTGSISNGHRPGETVECRADLTTEKE